MDYKNTLNLPRTDFAMKADLVAREPQRLEQWQRGKLYERIQARREGAEKFVLHDGPPFANGDVHVGTALNKILKDIIVKYKSLRGFHAPYVPGWDCHGLPIESKVTQELRARSAAAPAAAAPSAPAAFAESAALSADERAAAGITAAAGQAAALLDAATIRTACDAYARKYIGIQRAQFQRLGVLGDWENPYLTLDKEYEADELRLFADLVEKGFVYRGKKPVYWSIPFRTALAEAEVEYRDHVSQSVHVKFKLKGEPNTFVLIWTTTPWTLPANLAVAFNPAFFYSLVHAAGDAYLVCDSLLSDVSRKCGWGNYQIVRTVDAAELARLEYEHPFCARTGRLFPAGFVDNATGTGFVHIAPGHGADDYHLGRSAGLPIYSPVDDGGCFAYTADLPRDQQMPAGMVGRSLLEKHGESDANREVLHELRARNALVHHEHYHHSYPHCWRSKTPIIFRAMDQWFIRIDHVPGGPGSTPAQTKDEARVEPRPPTFRQAALAAIDRVTWVPDWGRSRIEAAVRSRPDWCISRQRTWGVPLPAFYDRDGNAILDHAIVRNVAALVEQHGSNVWFEKSAAELWSLVKPAGWKGAEAATKSTDTLDVWIDSGSSSRCVLMRRPGLLRKVGRASSLPSDSAELRSHSSTSHSVGEAAVAPGAGRMPALPWQADVYLEGSDQHRGWFQSSLLLSLAGNGAPPFKTVLTHGFMVDEDREKISKSRQDQGGYAKPQTADAYIKEWGADILRLWVASQDYRNDVVVSEERLRKVSETYRLLRNTLRYQLSNLYDFDPARHAVPDDRLTGLDRWILGEFSRLESEVVQAYDAFEFHGVYQRLSQFAAVELSAIYHDAVKDRLYTDAPESPRRRSTQTALHRMLTGLCQMLAPVLAFTADECWELMPGQAGGAGVHATDWQPRPFARGPDEVRAWEGLMALRAQALPELEKARQAKTIGKALEACLEMKGPDVPASETEREALRELLNVSQLAVSSAADASFTVTHADGQKCERCWHWETDVGSDAQHPTLCARCAGVVKAL
jgi:isoleucyl-tRNA synthetase